MLEEIPYQADALFFLTQFRHLPWLVALDSVCGRTDGRFDIISANPRVRLITCGRKTRIIQGDKTQTSSRCPLALIEDFLSAAPAPIPNLPFYGGAMGYFAYDLGRRFEHLPQTAKRHIDIPEMMVGIYDWAIVTDHLKQKTYLINQVPQGICKALGEFNLNAKWQSNLSKAQYQKAFDAIKHYILEGDCYQVNLAQQFYAPFTGDPLKAYQTIRTINPSPYAGFFENDILSVLSFSPERFIKVFDNQVETKPIKGTAPRDKDPKRDKANANALLASVKDNAENVMIVDLLRNDIGKISTFGSVKVRELCKLESFANVHHLVSTVTGELRPEYSSLDCLRACFPGGSITGAPKIRAQQIIDEQEPWTRGIYCGSLGYINHQGNLDTNITIRTLTAHNNTLYCPAGGAIVSDSNANNEYQETLDKVSFCLNTSVSDTQEL